MRSLSLVVIGLTLAATTAAAEPLRLADTDLDRVTADVRNIGVVARVVEALGYDGLDTDDTIIRIRSTSDGDSGFIDARRSAEAGADHAALAAPTSAARISGDDAGNAVGASGGLILRDGNLAGIGVAVFNSGAVAGNDRSATTTSTASQQIVVRTSSTDNGAVVQTTGTFARTSSSDSSSGVSSGGAGIRATGLFAGNGIGGVERSLMVRNDNASGGASIRSASLFAGNSSSGLSTSQLDRGITSGRFNASAFAGGAVTSMLRGSFVPTTSGTASPLASIRRKNRASVRMAMPVEKRSA